MTDSEIKSKFDHINARLCAIEDLIYNIDQLIKQVITNGDAVELFCYWGWNPKERPRYIIKRKEVK